MILFIKHIDIEGPDTLDVFFKKSGLKTKTVELYNGTPLPTDFDGINAVISLGGPMSVYEEDKYPFLKDEHKFLKKVLAQEIPFIGICLGSQLLAKACDIKVSKSPEKEIGFYPITIVPEGQNDPLFLGLPKQLDVFQWHEDMSQLTSDSLLLASSEKCPVQAFKIGRCAYGIQFHFEVTELTVGKWADAYFPDTDPSKRKQKQRLLEDYVKKKDTFEQVSEIINDNFLNIIRTCNEKNSYAQK